ncbi:MMPL family transporter [Treponema primitia]|uniref:MMPL family transporter n=1 Tax=Treponema primitia TaxID=88058 RepID=UPI0002554F30|nr:MMPL family transporter [Treponema primitia]
MKKPSFPSDRFFKPWLWLIVHGGIALALALSVLLQKPLGINRDLLGILPDTASLKPVSAADRLLGDRSSRGFYILAGAQDFERAKQAAVLLYQGLRGPAFESLSLYVDQGVMDQVFQYLYDYRYTLLDGESRELLESGQAHIIAEDALASAFGAFNFTALDTLDTDPFLLTDRGLRRFISTALSAGGTMSLRDDVLAAQQGETWYVMLRGVLSPRGAAITNADSGVQKIYALASGIEAENPDLHFVYSGIPFHSYESSSSAQREISLISTVTLVLVALLFLFVFRSPLPVLASLAAIGFSILLALMTALLFFREIHVLTFVFGTTLIGICVDYSIHYLVQRNGILRGIAMSLVSSEICFIALLFAPFSILRQFAVFSAAGLLSSFLTVSCLYPRFGSITAKENRIMKLPVLPKPGRFSGVIRKTILMVILCVSLAVLFFNRGMIRVENNITGLYTISPSLLESERIASSVLNIGSPGWYFIVSGDTPGELLEHEELLRNRLDREITRGSLKSYMASSLFVPSVKTQEQNYEAAKSLLPLAEDQFEYLGFPRSGAILFREDFIQKTGRYSEVDGLPPYLAGILENLWIGELGGRYYSCVLPLHVSVEEPFRALGDELDFVFFVNKVKDIGTGLDTLTGIMLVLLIIAYGVIAVTVLILYPRRDALRIIAAPLLPILVTGSVLAAAGIPLGFFSVVGIVLVFGLGLDYMFYRTESRNSNTGTLTVWAIVLSYLTTALSFGALVLSSFPPVHIFGLTVFSGLTTAFISAMLMQGRASSENHRT